MDIAREKTLSATLGAAIARERLAAGMTQEQVAEALQIGPEAVSRVERGVVMPSLPRLVDLSELFKCSIDRFLRDANDLAIDHAKLIETFLGPLDNADRRFVVDLVEKVCSRLGVERKD